MRGVNYIASGLEVFQQLTKLSIGKVYRKKRMVKALEKAPNLSSLTLENSNLPFETLIQVKDLTLSYCNHFTEFPATLIQLKSLEIDDCRELVSFPAFLPSLQHLTIEESYKLPMLQLFGDSKSPPLNIVKISKCNSLKEIQITRRINKLLIEQCPSANEISGREFVGSLVAKP
jgi:hypothetical protein